MLHIYFLDHIRCLARFSIGLYISKCYLPGTIIYFVSCFKHNQTCSSITQKHTHAYSRSSRPEVFSKNGVLRTFAKFTGKYLCRSLFFNKVSGLRSPTLLKKRLWHSCFPANFVKFLRHIISRYICPYSGIFRQIQAYSKSWVS